MIDSVRVEIRMTLNIPRQFLHDKPGLLGHLSGVLGASAEKKRHLGALVGALSTSDGTIQDLAVKEL
jgi:hypothetical protein